MATYKLIGKRFNRKYQSASAEPAYLAQIQASDAVLAFCGIPWTPTDVVDAQLTYHEDKEVEDGVPGYDWNAVNQEKIDAALFCFGHDKDHAYHRAGASAAVYRYELPDAAVGVSMSSLAVSLVSDPYNSTGVRVHVFTNSTGEIPMNCHTLRGEDAQGEVVDDGTTAAAVAKRVEQTVNNSLRWYPGAETVTIEPTGGLTLQKYLFVLVALEDYSVVRGNFLEGSAYMRNLVSITTSAAVSGWTDGETYRLGVPPDSVDVFKVVCASATQKNFSESVGRYVICVDSRGDDIVGDLVPGIVKDLDVAPYIQDYDDAALIQSYAADKSHYIALRSLYAKFYAGKFVAVNAGDDGDRTGAGFVVEYGKFNVRSQAPAIHGAYPFIGWRMLASSLVVPFSVPVDFSAERIMFNFSGGPSNGGHYNFWLKRNAYVYAPPDDVLKRPEIYLGGSDVDGWEYLGKTDSSNSEGGTLTFDLKKPLNAYCASILITAFASQDAVELGTSPMPFAPIGVPVAAGQYLTMKPDDIYLARGNGNVAAAIVDPDAPQPNDPLCFTAVTGGSTISMATRYEQAYIDELLRVPPTPIIHLYYSRDKVSWTPFVPDSTVVTLTNAGDKVYIAAGTDSSTTNKATGFVVEGEGEPWFWYNFVMSGKVAASGNVMSLLNRDPSLAVFVDSFVTGDWYEDNQNYVYLGYAGFQSLFKGCTSLVTAPALLATALATYCYYSMFGGCTSLVTAPALPATTLAKFGYKSMFNGCTSLMAAPALPATTLAEGCYYSMFNGCTSLMAAPALPAATLAKGCYYSMFNGCTSLLAAPALPATTLVNTCYLGMFNGCTSLVFMDVGCGYGAISDNYDHAYYAISDWLGGVSGPTRKFKCGESLFRKVSGNTSGPITEPFLVTANYVEHNETIIPAGWTLVLADGRA